MLANAALLHPEFPFQEFRLDYLPDPLSALPLLASFLHSAPSAHLLATCRPRRSGGRFPGSAEDERQILLAAAEAGFAILDLSLETAEELGDAATEQLRASGAAVLISFHDFHGTGDLEAIYRRIRALRPDFVKIIPTAQSLTDSLAVLDLLHTHRADTPALIALAMGESGILTRILGPRAGSAFTFAAAHEREATAPGQLTARNLVDLYRMRNISSTTRLFGVAGDPIHSSLSPLMLNTAFRHAGLDAVYLPLKTSSAPELLQAARLLPLNGFSITMPLKQDIVPLLDTVDPLAARIGAVNTVRRSDDGRLHGANTDVAGIVIPLEQRLSLQDARVVVLGAGGAARAAVFGCVDRGAKVHIVNRSPEAAARLAKEAGAEALPREALTTEHFDILINATPAGMRGNALTLPLEKSELNADLVFDLVYNPIETPLLALARARGLQVIPGVEMFVQQGARQFELWTGETAPLHAMQAVVFDRLQEQQRLG